MCNADLRTLLIQTLLPLDSLTNPGLQIQKFGAEHTPFTHPPGQKATHFSLPIDPGASV